MLDFEPRGLGGGAHQNPSFGAPTSIGLGPVFASQPDVGNLLPPRYDGHGGNEGCDGCDGYDGSDECGMVGMRGGGMDGFDGYDRTGAVVLFVGSGLQELGREAQTLDTPSQTQS